MSDSVKVARDRSPICWLDTGAVEAVLRAIPTTRRLRCLGVLTALAYVEARDGQVRSLERLAAELDVTPRALAGLVKDLEGVGALRQLAGEDGTAGWVLTAVVRHAAPAAPAPQLPLIAEAAPKREKVKVKDADALGVFLVETFNEVFGRRFAAWAGAKPSDQAKTIGRRAEQLGLSREEWQAKVAFVKRNPPSWWEGEPGLMDVFGPNAIVRTVEAKVASGVVPPTSECFKRESFKIDFAE